MKEIIVKSGRVQHLSKTDLAELLLSRATLSNVESDPVALDVDSKLISSAPLSSLTIARLGFFGCIAHELVFERCRFEKSTWSKSELLDCRFSECQFVECNFQEVEFQNCKFDRVSFVDCDHFETTFSRNSLRQVSFLRGSVENMIFYHCPFLDDLNASDVKTSRKGFLVTSIPVDERIISELAQLNIKIDLIDA